MQCVQRPSCLCTQATGTVCADSKCGMAEVSETSWLVQRYQASLQWQTCDFLHQRLFRSSWQAKNNWTYVSLSPQQHEDLPHLYSYRHDLVFILWKEWLLAVFLPQFSLIHKQKSNKNPQTNKIDQTCIKNNIYGWCPPTSRKNKTSKISAVSSGTLNSALTQITLGTRF